MGCELTKLAKNSSSSKTNNGGVNFDSIAQPPPPPVTDPRLPLTAKQKYCMVASWKGISRAMESTGITMFIKYVSIILLHSLFLYINF